MKIWHNIRSVMQKNSEKKQILENKNLLNDLTLKNTHFENEDFSGRNLENFFSENCNFIHCKFENMNVKRMCFGTGEQSIYIECSFNRSIFSGITRENAKFIRCSFDHTDLSQFDFFETEFIDCTFSGKLYATSFYGQRFSVERGHLVNEFINNDFSQASFQYIQFMMGIDLSRQKLPVSSQYIYIVDGAKLIQELKSEMNNLGKKLRIGVMLWLELYEEHLKRGQKQFFLKSDEISVNLSVIGDMTKLIRKIIDKQQTCL